MTKQPARGITAEQYRAALALLAAQREAKKQAAQQAADQATLELARERIRRQDARDGLTTRTTPGRKPQSGRLRSGCVRFRRLLKTK